MAAGRAHHLGIRNITVIGIGREALSQSSRPSAAPCAGRVSLRRVLARQGPHRLRCALLRHVFSAGDAGPQRSRARWTRGAVGTAANTSGPFLHFAPLLGEGSTSCAARPARSCARSMQKHLSRVREARASASARGAHRSAVKTHGGLSSHDKSPFSRPSGRVSGFGTARIARLSCPRRSVAREHGGNTNAPETEPSLLRHASRARSVSPHNFHVKLSRPGFGSALKRLGRTVPARRHAGCSSVVR